MAVFAQNLRHLADRCIGLFLLALLAAAGAASGVAEERVEESAMQRLGRILFFDERLSADGKVSCATCHQPDREFADDRAVSPGAFGRTGTRNAPSLLARRAGDPLFWDGRRPTLESQVMDPLVNPFEHGLADLDELLQKVSAIGAYQTLFDAAFERASSKITAAKVARSLSVYIESLPAAPTRVEQFLAGNGVALTDSEKQGMEIFAKRAQCAQCHLIDRHSAGFSDQKFHAVGIGLSQDTPVAPLVRRALEKVDSVGLELAIFSDAEVSRLGRFLVTKDPRDIAKFRTPALRRVSATAPYMHDGSIATLAEALDRELYYRSLANGTPIALTPNERADLLAFLAAL